jgi:hypothetical protein
VSDDKAVLAGDRWARACFAATAAVVLVGLVIQAGVVASNDDAVFPTVPGRIFSMFCFDVDTLGYGKVALNSVWIAVLFLALSAAATALDARLPGAAAA